MVLGAVIERSAAIERAALLAARPGRTMLGITGPPGSGKTTLSAAIAEALGQSSAVVPMDGFHLADCVLESLGLRDRKGAPETFDSVGYGELLARLRRNDVPVIYAPSFERELEQPIAGAIAVPAAATLIVTEGNYLLSEGDGWRAAREFLDEVWYCEAPDELRQHRLVDRHVRFGKTGEQAREWVDRVDEPNARAISATRVRADQVVALD